MEESILDVQLVNRPGTQEGDAKDDAYHGLLDDGTESLIEIDPWLLREAANHPTSLVTRKAAVGMELVLVDPFS
jgi:hypothetical protein